MNDLEDKFLEDLNANIGIINRVCKVYLVDHDERQDLFQEIVFQLWKSYPGFQGKSKFSTWMYRVALNTAISGLRKKYKTISGFNQSEKLLQQVPEEPVENDERISTLYDAIRELTPVERAIIMLHLEGNDYEQIGSIVGITSNYVSVKLVRIKKKLELRLKK